MNNGTQEDVPQTLVTNNYNIFRQLSSNRGVSTLHVSQLVESMKRSPQLFASRPILVNENMFIIDGQHRFAAAKQLRRPIYYVVAKGIGVDETRELNTTQLNWTMIDFAKSYASTGNEHYKGFLSALAKYPMLPPTTVRLYLAGRMADNGRLNSVFKSGEFIIDKPNLANIYLEQLNEIKRRLPGVPMTRALASAFYKLFERPDVFDYDYFVNKLENDSVASLIVPASDMKYALRSIEDAYNYNRSEKTRVRFY